MKVKRAIDTPITLSRLSVQPVIQKRFGADLQYTENEDTTQSELLGSGEMQFPYEWHG